MEGVRWFASSDTISMCGIVGCKQFCSYVSILVHPSPCLINYQDHHLAIIAQACLMTLSV